MTDEEARKVKVGDALLTRINGGRYEVVDVTEIREGGLSFSRGFIVARRMKKTQDRLGNPLPGITIFRSPEKVGWAAENEARKDPVTANVFADWLEENGHHEAAKALRAAFPVGTPEVKG